MPITADYKWEDSPDVIAVLVPLRGAKLSGEQVFMSNEYVKVLTLRCEVCGASLR